VFEVVNCLLGEDLNCWYLNQNEVCNRRINGKLVIFLQIFDLEIASKRDVKMVVGVFSV
jgi:hypothetical protein